MAFSIKNDEADRLARQLSAITGESLTETVVISLRERLDRHQGRGKRVKAGSELARMALQLQRLPVMDSRSDEEILGSDESGLPI